MSCKMKANFNSPKIDEQKLSEFMLKAIIQSQSNSGMKLSRNLVIKRKDFLLMLGN
jgi:hypothetical protein